MEVYSVSLRNYVSGMSASEEDIVHVFGIAAEELQRRCEGGVTREAWAALGRGAHHRGILCARRECLTCYRQQWVIPFLEVSAETA